MIDRSQIKSASFEVRRKARATHAFEKRDHVLIVPHDQEKAVRAVVFLTNGMVICVNADTGETCEANEFKNVCYHVFSANRRREINAKRRATIAAKKQGVKAA